MKDDSKNVGSSTAGGNDTPALPAVVDRATWLGEMDALRVREKAHTREGDAIAAARRRLPMVEVDPTITLTGVGLLVSELIAVNCADIELGTGAHVRVERKGRKQRAVPLTKDAQAVLAVWLDERAGLPDDPLFPTRTGRRARGGGSGVLERDRRRAQSAFR